MRKNKIKSAIILSSICISIFHFSCNNSKKEVSTKKEESSISSQNTEWINALIMAYRALTNNRNIAAADLLLEATDLMPKKNWENYFVCATIYAPKGENDKAFLSIQKAIEAGLKDVELLNSVSEFSLLRNDSRWKDLINSTNNKRKAYLNSINNPQLLEELENMWKEDQFALSKYEENIKSLDTNASVQEYRMLFKPVKDRWNINKDKLDSIINIHGWPGYKLVGEDGAKISWAIPQHHPNIFFKEKCLILIAKSIENKDTDPNHYAELKDRIARETWQKQTFGASMGEGMPYPIEDPANVDNRRIALGLLEPVEIYAYYHGIKYQRPSIEVAKTEMKTIYDKAQKNYTNFEYFITKKNADSANVYINKGIKFHGDISNSQLYKAAIKLAQTDNKRSHQISLKIIKVLIWRKWEKRFEILNQIGFSSLHDKQEWIKIKELLEKSK
ncbi:MAG: hypothetical protein JKY22_01210 [Flavobacteriaceae bacterium]|nr:hypothetical protein [Flavobacteriaceae bacterium]